MSKADTPAGSGPEDADDKKNKEEKMDVDEELPEGTDMASVVKRRRVVAARDAKVCLIGDERGSIIAKWEVGQLVFRWIVHPFNRRSF